MHISPQPISSPHSVKALTTRFTDLYLPTPPRWSNISSIVSELGWDDQVVQTGKEYFTSQGVGEKFIHELVGAATRVNYAQDADKIHALEAAVSLALCCGKFGVDKGILTRASSLAARRRRYP